MRPAKNILLVEDEPTLQRIFGSVLADAGHHVESVGTAEQALERLGSPAGTPVDLVLSDKNLPAMNGLDLLGAVRSLEQRVGRTVAFVLCTGYPSRESALALLGGDGDGYLVKPFRSLTGAVAEIQSVLSVDLGARRAGRRLARELAHALGGHSTQLASGTAAAVLVDDPSLRARVEAALGRAGVDIVDVGALWSGRKTALLATRVEDLQAFARKHPGAALVLLDAGASFSDLVTLLGAGGGAVSDPGLVPGEPGGGGSG